MKIQLSPTRIIPDALTVWNQPGPEVDVVMDLKKLSFADGFCDVIYSFHLLERYFPAEISEALGNWFRCLKPGGKMWITLDDFESLCREFVGGGMSIDSFNANFTHPMYFTRENLVRYLTDAGFKEDDLIIWFESVPNEFQKEQHELVFECKK